MTTKLSKEELLADLEQLHPAESRPPKRACPTTKGYEYILKRWTE